MLAVQHVFVVELCHADSGHKSNPRSKCCKRRAAGRRWRNHALALESLGDFLHTGHIKFLQKAESTFKASAEERYKIVSIVGFPAHRWFVAQLFRNPQQVNIAVRFCSQGSGGIGRHKSSCSEPRTLRQGKDMADKQDAGNQVAERKAVHDERSQLPVGGRSSHAGLGQRRCSSDGLIPCGPLTDCSTNPGCSRNGVFGV